MNYWGDEESDLDDRLNLMRENGLTFAYGHSDIYLTFNVLHPIPLLKIRNVQDVE